MSYEHNHAEELADEAAAYALGALDREEAAAFERHLAACARCQSTVRDMQETTSLLALAVDVAEPRAELRDRVLTSARRERPVTQAQTTSSTAAIPLRGGFWRSLLGARLPAAVGLIPLVLLLVLSVMYVNQQNELASLRASLSREQDMWRLISDPQVQLTDMASDGVQAKLLMSPDQDVAYLVIVSLPPLPEDKAYQVWLVDDGQRTSAAVFHPARRRGVVLQGTKPLREYDAIGITEEPAGGSPAPTGSPILSGRLQ